MIAVILTLPALVKVDIGGAPVPVAFFAVVSIGVIGLYVAFAIPIYYRWKAGDSFEGGRVDARLEVQVDVHRGARSRSSITSIIALLPTSLGGVPWNDRLRLEVRELHDPRRAGRPADPLWICWHLSVKNWFTGPKHTIDLPEQPAPVD